MHPVEIHINSPEATFKCDQCGAMSQSKDTLNNHIAKTHIGKYTCKECDYTSTSVNSMNDDSKLEHGIEPLDGSAEITKSKKKIKHDELWCYKCEEQQPDCKGCEFQISNRPVIKAHAQRA